MTNLTEQWKRGELKEGNYYIKDKYGNFIIAQYLPDYDYDYQDGHALDGYRWCALGFDYDDLEQDSVVEVLSAVPSFEEYSRLEWYAGCGPDRIVELNKENRQLRKWCEEFNALDVAKENAKLKELLSKCVLRVDTLSDILDFLKDKVVYKQSKQLADILKSTREIIKEIDEVVNVAED